MTDHRDQPLAPAEFSPRDDLPGAEPPPPPPRMRGWLPAGLALFVLLWVVVFFLPDWVATSQSDAGIAGTPAPGDALKTPVSPAASTPEPQAGSTPFADAQLAKVRREAQDMLQTLLELQGFLQERDVEQWAGDAYQSALEVAADGDAAYRDRDFISAAAAYSEATNTLTALEQRLPEEIDTRAAALNQHIEALAIDEANMALAELQRMAGDEPNTETLARRVAVLPDVAKDLESAATAASEDDFAAAVEATESALTRDSQHAAAGAQLGTYRESLRIQRFRAAMSEGYQALAAEDYDLAESRFGAADKLSPGAPEPRAARLELEAARTAARLRTLRDEAQGFEIAEAWDKALARYDEALATDSTLVFAREGRVRVEQRAILDKAVVAILDAPERLVETVALADAQQTLAALQAQSDSGPRYQEQRKALEQLLRDAQTPVSVLLTSDGLTDVTIARFRHLGAFAQQTVTLRPGRYTAVGIRDGFRDVRVTFDVMLDKPNPQVTVLCEEPI